MDEPRIGKRRPDTTVGVIPAALLSPGDFVQATIKFDVVVSEFVAKGKTTTTVMSRPSLLAVVQLLNAREVVEVRNLP